ncbi:arsenate reductase (glutaredoxin) [Bdellovibrio sp. HCB-162]|uniref:arsenate reductase (glutaredoxin) n=1 Tax=Bdellovibrio sp. HCB-162 TaxID=3394234 RepID=UPI0039BC99A8
MDNWIIYHNPQCSKSREVLSLLKDHNVEPEIVEYLKRNPTEAELRDIIEKLKGPLANIVRTKEEDYKKLNFDTNSVEEVVKYLLKHPHLMERPIVIKNDEAVIGRPTEAIKKLLS